MPILKKLNQILEYYGGLIVTLTIFVLLGLVAFLWNLWENHSGITPKEWTSDSTDFIFNIARRIVGGSVILAIALEIIQASPTFIIKHEKKIGKVKMIAWMTFMIGCLLGIVFIVISVIFHLFGTDIQINYK